MIVEKVGEARLTEARHELEADEMTVSRKELEAIRDLIKPAAVVHERIKNFGYGGPPSPLLAVQEEARDAHEALMRIMDVLGQGQEDEGG